VSDQERPTTGEPPRPAARPRTLRHELRNPLSQILGYAELLEEDAGADGQERVVDDLRRIQRAARTLMDLIDEHVPSEALAGEKLVRGGAAEPAGGPPAAAPAAPAASAPPAGEAAPPDTAAGAEERDAAGGRAAQATSAAAVRAGVEILVVDDNEMNRDMLARRLRKQGYGAETAEDGYKALELLAARPFDLMLLDIMMPGLTGYDVLKKVRETRSMSELPVIMATAKDQGEDIVSALKLGANDYVTKPLDFAVVVARVKTQLALKDAMEEVQRLARELELRNQFIRKTFGRYLSDDVVSQLLGRPDGLALGGEKRTLTLIMSDIRGFSAVSERLSPEQVVRLLNRYLGAMAEVITRHRGTIDEFIGDGILALFGAPTQGPDDAVRAVACAVDMQLRVAAVNEENLQEGLPAIQMGIAVNTGEVVVGNIGSETRAKYGVVGSPVNLTARIESCTLGGQVFVSESTRSAVGSTLEVGQRMTLDVKGFSEPIAFYEVKRLGAPYDLAPPSRVADLADLWPPLALRFSVLEGKHVSDHGYEGALVRLGDGAAEIRSKYTPQALTNLRLRVADGEGEEIPADLYAKVVEADAGSEAFVVGFTSVPPEVETFLADRRKNPKR